MDFASYVHQYYSEGYLVFQEGGEAGKVCADDMSKTVPSEQMNNVLLKLGKLSPILANKAISKWLLIGESMCNMLEYSELTDIAIVARDFAEQFSGSDRREDQLAALLERRVRWVRCSGITLCAGARVNEF